jgi:Raf kinase inhibitor-like YbhB/YbcL family protein
MRRLILTLFLVLTACTSKSAEPPSSAPGGTIPAELAITSPVFAQNAAIPVKYTCQGSDISPALEWPASPAGTKSLALIMDDPDAPVGVWVHWIVYNLPPDTRGLQESASQGKSTQANLPSGTLQGKNSFNRVNYGGPCPPSGEHHYRFHLYALDITISGETLDKTALLKVMEGHILSQGELVGLYKKQ